MSFFKDIKERVHGKLLASGRYLGIIEAGHGVGLQSAITSMPGSSKYFYIGMCPYGKGNFKGAERAVSVVRLEAMLSKLMDGMGNHQTNSINICVTGCYRDGNIGQTHAYVLMVITGSHELMFHIVHNSNIDRVSVNNNTAIFCLWMLDTYINYPKMPLSSHVTSGITALRELGMHVDVVPDILNNGFPLEDLVTHDNPIYIKSSGFAYRAVDFLRQDPILFRGSFNPPTMAHYAMGSEAGAYEICIDNIDKGIVGHNDLVHRIKMLNLMGKNVLLTRNPYFSQLTDTIRMVGKARITYSIGYDTAMRLIKYLYKDPFRNMHKEATYRIISTPDQRREIKNACSNTIGADTGFNFEFVDAVEHMGNAINMRSSSFRENPTQNMGMLHTRVKEYITANKLYTP